MGLMSNTKLRKLAVPCGTWRPLVVKSLMMS